LSAKAVVGRWMRLDVPATWETALADARKGLRHWKEGAPMSAYRTFARHEARNAEDSA